jgi:hypothetical protein
MLWYNFSNWLFVPFIKTFSLSPTMIVEKQKFKNYEGKTKLVHKTKVQICGLQVV